MTNECKCTECKGACENRPGWFKPGEAEKVAKFKGIQLQELFEQYLAIDWWVSYPNDIFLLAPAIVGLAGREYPSDPRGQCAFYEDGLCTIHDVKPYECRMYMHDSTSDEQRTVREEVVAEWKQNQEQPQKLLGREPEASEYGGGLFF